MWPAMYRSSAMRMAAAALKPREVAALVKLVVLNGAGRGTLREVCLTAVTWPGVASFSKTAVARASSVKRSSLWTALNRLPVGVQLHLDHPERLGHEGPPLLLPLGDEHQGGRLHPAHAQELAAQTRGGQRDEPGERRPPDEVDVLPGLAGPGQRLGQLVEMREGPVDLARRQGREAGAAHGAHQLGVLFDRQVEGLQPDQLALAVVVGRDDERWSASAASFLTVRTTDLAVSVLTRGASMSVRGSTLRHSENSGGKSTCTTWPLRPTRRCRLARRCR